MESCRSLRESATMWDNFLETAFRNCCSVMSMPYLRAFSIRSLCSSCLVVSSIFSASSLGDDCLAAIRAAEVITLDLSFASKGFSFFGIPLGMIGLFLRKSIDLSRVNYKRIRMATKMTGKECMAILAKAGISRDEFAGMMGIKRSTMRTCVHGNRISRKMVDKLRELAGEEEEKEEIAEVDAMIKEVVKPYEEAVKKMDASDVQMGKVYLIPQNKYLRLVEFADGSHGKFRAKPGKYWVGDKILLRHLERDMWEVAK